jgi:hypothetical protein
VLCELHVSEDVVQAPAAMQVGCIDAKQQTSEAAHIFNPQTIPASPAPPPDELLDPPPPPSLPLFEEPPHAAARTTPNGMA